MNASTRASRQPLHTFDVYLPDATATARAGAALAPELQGGMIVTLDGDLGVGKTTLVRGVLRARGVDGLIKSPSFSLVEHYPIAGLYFYHIDFYRFTDPSEWETTGLSDCFRADAVCLIEWPQNAGAFLPRADLALALSLASPRDGRLLDARPQSAEGERCVDAIATAFRIERTTR